MEIFTTAILWGAGVTVGVLYGLVSVWFALVIIGVIAKGIGIIK